MGAMMILKMRQTSRRCPSAEDGRGAGTSATARHGFAEVLGKAYPISNGDLRHRRVKRELTDAYRLTADEAVAALDTDLRRGLAGAAAAARVDTIGRNELAVEARVSAWRRFFSQFRDVLVILLLVATAVSVALWFVERDTALPYEAIAIFAVVLLNAAMGFIQEARAEAAVAALRAMSASEASVIRDGERHRVPAAELVPGDVVLIEQGDTIPADSRCLESTAR